LKAAEFEYLAPTSIEEAVALLTVAGTVPLAGGQSLMPLVVRRQVRPVRLCDLNRIEGLSGVEITADSVRVGAMTRQRDVETDPRLATAQPILPLAVSSIGFLPIRHRGTIGGSLVHADPCAELPAAAALLGAVLHLQGLDGVRQLTASEFFLDGFRTALRSGELLTSVVFPRLTPGTRYAATKLRPGQDPALGCLVSLRVEDARIADPRVVVFGGGGASRRLTGCEDLLHDEPPGPELFAACGRRGAADVPLLPGAPRSATYRGTQAASVISAALTKAMEKESDG
jgi:carbon-monoxide dehydrogenase medium subunit